jgi:hypothetical protein
MSVLDGMLDKEGSKEGGLVPEGWSDKEGTEDGLDVREGKAESDGSFETVGNSVGISEAKADGPVVGLGVGAAEVGAAEIPVQLIPSPVKPALHVQVKLPDVFTQEALVLQGTEEHSSLSVHPVVGSAPVNPLLQTHK